MIIDSRIVAPGTVLRADLCIVGAGPAGITIAREFVDRPLRVILLESGETAVRQENQSLCRGDITGYDYPPLHVCRRRILGGSTSYWGGWSHPLDDIDFEERAWVPYSGWPFTKADLKDEYARAHAIWKLGKCGYDCETPELESGEHLLNPDNSSFENILFQINGTRFGKTYKDELEKAGNLDLMLHANVLEIEMDRENRTALSVRAATLGGNRFSVAARKFVLAAGGIENPRILLASRGSRPAGVGNDHDVVGRFFADHLHVPLRTVALDGRQVPDFYHSRKIGQAACRGGMALTEGVRRRDKLLGFAITIHNPDNPHDVLYPAYTNLGYASLQALAGPLIDGELPDLLGYHFRTVLRHPINALTLSFRKLIKAQWRVLMVGCRAEQIPNPDSRILLDHEKDALGMNKVRLDWRLTQQDVDSLRRARQILDKEWNFPRKDPPSERTAAERPAEIAAASHHMGTTRMHRDPRSGVVDETCRVHGTSNLFIAGSSVFPTSGWAPPTLTIIALALRLADYLKQSQPLAARSV
jgi:choline dehydrogenase-like flavoprotein